ncbi:MAG: amidase [Acidobacteriota bacterium]|nr:amidase [Acidobacteriota bacterium]
MSRDLDRRTLFKLGAVGAAASAGLACTPPPESASEEKVAGAEPPPFELGEVTVDELQQGMASGRWSARRLTELYLERIEAVDRSGPRLNSIIQTNPGALEIADRLDEERRGGTSRGPLHGIPIVIKDNIDTADGMATTAGSLALAGTVALADAFVVSRLRRAGAVILAKANLSEWANFRSERSSSGWSGVLGQTRNPFALDRNPCGSSSGSGAAVSASLAALAIGTETDGSVICPSNANGVVGIKPTVGLVSRSGIVPIAHSQDTAGPMARTVRDAAILLGVMAAEDPTDAGTKGSAAHAHADYTEYLDPAGLAGARIGIWRERFGFHEKVDAVLEESVAAMRSAGAEVIDDVELPGVRDAGEPEYEVLLYEFKTDLETYLRARGADTTVRTLADLIAFNESHRAEEMPYFEQEIFHQAQEKGSLTDTEYLDARATCLRLTRDEGIDLAIATHSLDAIIGPSGGPAWVTDLVNGDHFGGGSSRAAAVSGYPNITVPAGFIHGLPVGLSFFGPAWSEPTLLRFAYAFEQLTTARRAPRFLPTAELG